jgi:xylulose-5-phosphate/fructose-6-phosphate phosphoketolase
MADIAASQGRQPIPLTDDEVAAIDAYWRAANTLSVDQIHLLANRLLRQPLTLARIPESELPALFTGYGHC